MNSHSNGKLSCRLVINSFLLVPFLLLPVVALEIEQRFEVSELAPVGHQIGYINNNSIVPEYQVNFYIVFSDQSGNAEKTLSVNEKTGEIIVQNELDYETNSQYVFLVIPSNGSATIKVIIDILDENDNEPTFPVNSIDLEISEYARIDTELALPSAIDPDSPKNSIVKYSIAGGNVNNVFRLAANKLNNVMYVDLVVNGQLDREYRDRYDIIIEAFDGGDPPKRGRLVVHVKILDANDNAPEFLRPRYSVNIASNSSVGTQIITVLARDNDAGDNAEVSYRFQLGTHKNVPFKIDSDTGVVTVESTPLTAGTTYELSVIAADHGVPQPLETTAFLTIHVQNAELSRDGFDISIMWLTDDGTPRLSEGLTVGYILARVAVYGKNYEKLVLSQTDSLCLKQTDSPSVYLVLFCGPLDRDTMPEIRINFRLLGKTGKTILDHPVIVEIIDINDNAPQWNDTEYRITVDSSSVESVGQNVYRFIATDIDFGENARITYTVSNTDLFDIDPETGVLFLIRDADCNTKGNDHFTVVARDNGVPPLNSSVNVVVDFIDTKAAPPVFDKSLYEVTVKEDADVSTCLLQVLAHDESCMLAKHNQLRYAQKDTPATNSFKIDAETGKICVQSALDFETTPRYQLTVFAINAAGLNTSTLVNIIVEDVNDNSPVFEPATYNLTVYNDLPVGTALLSVRAVDRDLGPFGEIRYSLTQGAAHFHIDSINGRLYSDKPLQAFTGQTLVIKVMAKDSGGLSSTSPATVQVSVLMNEKECPHFVRGLYEFTITEDILPGIVIGAVNAVSSRAITYRIVAGNNGNFELDPKSGKLIVSSEIDADMLDVVLLNIEAKASDNCASYSQIRILVHDSNDNAPEFDLPLVETSITEDFPIHEPFFAVQAIDKDKHENGKVTYELIKSVPPCPIIIRPLTGQLLLAAPLDYEKTQRYNLTIRAQDQGIPPRFSFSTVFVNVLDINDNTPEFTSQLYDIEISEQAPLMTPVVTVKATDRDSGANAEVRYRFATDTASQFGMNQKTGEIFVRRNLDREDVPEFSFLVIAYDDGKPALSSNASVRIKILDVNDNTPNCSQFDEIKISDDMDGGTVLSQLNAYDPDEGPNGTVIFKLQQTHDFIKVKKTGEVMLKRKIRPDELKFSTQVAVIVEDQGPNPRPIVCMMYVSLDVTESEVVLLEAVDKSIHLTSADTPTKILNHIKAENVSAWFIEKGPISSFFTINEGVLMLNAEIVDEKFAKPQSLTISMVDSNNRKKQVTLIVRYHRIMNPNNETIVTRVKESTAIGTKLLSLKQDVSQNEYYSLLKRNPIFELDEQTGNVHLAQKLDYNMASVVELQVSENHLNNFEKKEVTLVFELDDANNHSPKFINCSSVAFNVSEMERVGAFIGQVIANDEDDGPNGVVKYRLLGLEDAFFVNVETGMIFLQRPLHYHIKPSYYLTVEAEDSATQISDRLKSHCPVFINVIDTNDNTPVFQSKNFLDVLIDRTFNMTKPIHYFVATDVDTGDAGKLQYQIVEGNSQNDFILNSATGALYIRRPINGRRTLTVRTSDISSLPRFVDQPFVINFIREKTAWRYFDKESVSIELPFNPPSETIVYEFLQISSSEKVTFELFPGKMNNFAVEPVEGTLKTVGRVFPGMYEMLLHVTSQETNNTDAIGVAVRVRSTHSAGPKIVQNSCGNITVVENQHLGNFSRVFAYSETTENENDSLIYHIEGGGDHGFTIDENTGILSSDALDRESKPEYFLIVSVSDNGVPKKADICTIRIIVKDENDNAPIFGSVPNFLEINDSIKAPSIILQLTATDLDSGNNGQVTYQILDDPSGAFEIDPDIGTITFARDYLFPRNEFLLRVGVKDLGSSTVLSNEKDIRVVWSRQKVAAIENTPQFLQHKYMTYVLEGLPKRSFVVKVETSNRILRHENLIFSIVSGNDDSAFEIDETGNVRTAIELDFEIQQIYILKIRGSNRFGQGPETSVVIHVLDANDNAPSLMAILDIELLENAYVGTHIATVTATDVDLNSQLEFALDTKSPYFYINRFTGSIHTLQTLDYEQYKSYVIGVNVFDGVHVVRTNFTVSIIDVNDNAPKFASYMSEITIPRLAATNTIIGQITAVDADNNESGDVDYEIFDGHDHLSIDAKTGQLRLVSPILGERVVFAAVKATDRGIPRLSSTTFLKLKLGNSDTEEKPEFDKDVYTLFVTESYPRFLPFGKLTLKKTICNTCPSEFYIEDELYAEVFGITAAGEIYLIRELDREAVQEYRFQIGLCIKNRNTDLQFATIIVKVTDFNDNAPVFLPDSSNQFDVYENMKKGAILGRVAATDADIDNNGYVEYAIIGGNEYSIIKIDGKSGAVMFNHWNEDFLLENPGLTRVNVIIVAFDKGNPSLWTVSNTYIVFNIDAWSGTAPIFPLPVYRKYVAETLPIGSAVLKVQAHNKWGADSSEWQYSIMDNDNAFNIDPRSGEIMLVDELDYEKITTYEFVVSVHDARRRTAVAPVQIFVVSVDEYAPIFSKSTYIFEIPFDATTAQRIGSVHATDDDVGADGRVTYSILNDQEVPFVGIDADSGVLVLRSTLPTNKTSIEFIVIASSGMNQHSRAVVYLEVSSLSDVNVQSTVFKFSQLHKITLIMAGIFVVMFLTLCLFVICFFFKRKKPSKPQKQVYSVARGNVAVMADINRMSPTFANTRSMSFDGQKAASIISSSGSHSGHQSNPNRSTYNENFANRSQPDSGIDPDAISMSSSVTDYLLQIGIAPSRNDYGPASMIKSATASERMNLELANLIYAKVDDFIPKSCSVAGNGFGFIPTELSADELSSIITQDQSIHRGPTFQPLTEVLSQISRLKAEMDNQPNAHQSKS